MADDSRRRFSRGGNRIKQEGREQLEEHIARAVEPLILKHDPTIRKPALEIASKLAGVVASKLAVQTQLVQRSLPSIANQVDILAAEFIEALVAKATSSFAPDLERFKAALPPVPVPAIEQAGDWAGIVAGPTVLERHYGISRSTLFRWHKRDEAIGLKTGSKKFVFPVRQFIDGRPVEGLKEVAVIFGDHRLAWQWLIRRNSTLGGMEPLSLLIEGGLDKVLAASTIDAHHR